MFSIKSSPVFGKTAVMECRVKESANKLGENATLYKLNTDSTGDFYDVVRSKNTTCILNDYVKAYKYGNSLSEYYILQDDYTGEVISCAQVSRRYRNSNKENPGNCTFISAMSENKKYLNGAEPILAYMTKVAAERYDKSLYAAYNIKNSDYNSKN